jgi:Zn-dependent M28 family amino/carboxypeptidase
MKRLIRFSPLLLGAVCLAGCSAWAARSRQFDGPRALRDVATQLAFGPRTLGSEAHRQFFLWLEPQLREAGWDVIVQEIPYGEITLRNVIATRGRGHPWVLLGAHYDSRFVADRDPDLQKQSQPVPGANDGASGVAVLLELARSLPKEESPQVWLAFLDAEDNGNLPGYDWIMGSTALAEQFAGSVDKPDAVVIVDMIGDADLNIFLELNSDPTLAAEIWEVAHRRGHPQFLQQPKHRILDDHLPFLEAGIPAVDIIDFDYPHWHTTADTLDKVSAESLFAVGDTLFHWVGQQALKTR